MVGFVEQGVGFALWPELQRRREVVESAGRLEESQPALGWDS